MTLKVYRIHVWLRYILSCSVARLEDIWSCSVARLEDIWSCGVARLDVYCELWSVPRLKGIGYVKARQDSSVCMV